MSRSFSSLSIGLLALPAVALWAVIWLSGDPWHPGHGLAARTWDRQLEAKVADIARAAAADAGAEVLVRDSSAALDPLVAEVLAARPDARPDGETLNRLAALCAVAGRLADAIALADRPEATPLAMAVRSIADGDPSPLERAAVDRAAALPGVGPWLRTRLAATLADAAGTEDARAWATERHDDVTRRLAAMGVLVGTVAAAAAFAGLVLLVLAPWRLRRWLRGGKATASPARAAGPFEGGTRTAIVTLNLWFFAHVAGGVALGVVAGLVADGEVTSTPTAFAALLAGSSLLTGIVGLVLVRHLARPASLFEALGLGGRCGGRGARWAFGAFAAALPLVVGASLANELLVGPEPLPPALALLAGDPGALALGLLLLATVVLAPLLEEAVFRGYLYRVLRERFGVGGGALVSGALFAVVHVQPANVLPLTALGVLFALTYEATGSLRAPILAHALWNFGSLAIAGFVFG